MSNIFYNLHRNYAYMGLRYWLILIFLLVSARSFCQPGGRIEIVHANDLHAQRINGEDVQRLKGNVLFRQNDVTMSCDSAVLYSVSNTLTAYGQVHLNQHDTLNLYSDQLDYDGKTKYAIMRQHVKMTDRQMVLITDRLDYDFVKKEGFYTTGGHITDAENKLSSQIGYYFSETRDMYFKKNVLLVNPKFTMKCDTLQYNTLSKKAIFHGPTNIKSDKDLIYCESGWYNTQTNKARFGKNAYLNTEDQYLYGDSLFYDRNTGYGQAVHHIRLSDTSEKLLVTGDYAEHFQKSKQTFITRRVLVTKGMKNDSMYMSSDTIRLNYDSSGKYRIIKGYYHAKIYNKQFQAISDSLVYSTKDSTIDMYKNPVFWFGNYQATAKHIVIHTRRNKVSLANLYKDAFLASAEDSVRFSQIKGRDMTGYFRDNELYKIDVNGNGECMYYVRDDKKAYIGLNKIISSNITIDVANKKISRINFIRDPDADLMPMKDVNPLEARLPGFSWRGKERPLSISDLLQNDPGK